MALAEPTDAALDAILSRDTRLLEIGAGDGAWARALRSRGADIVALDPVPSGEGVRFGSHLDAANYPGRSLLICWPPDATDVNAWITAVHPYLLLIGSHMRFFYAPSERAELELKLPEGRKSGPNVLKVYQLTSVA